MQFRLYLLDITELEDTLLLQKTLSLMDSFRKGKLYKYKNTKDRMHQIAAGLLLQLGLLELEMPTVSKRQGTEIKTEVSLCKHPKTELLHSHKDWIYLLQASQVLQELERWQGSEEARLWEKAGFGSLPIEAAYVFGKKGKPYWQHKFLETLPVVKKFMWFSISHSGQYVGLAMADREIGLDIQEPRSIKYFEGGYEAFSRMEAYAKCTGEGFAGFEAYKERNGDMPGYKFDQIKGIGEYAITLCHKFSQ